MGEATHLVELFKEACRLTGAEQEAFVRRVGQEDEALAASLTELLAQQEAPTIEERTSEADASPFMSLARGDDSKSTDFVADVVQRLTGRTGNFGRYELKGEIDRGGQGAVLRVWDGDLRRDLAMKVALGKVEEATSTRSADTRALGRFLEEAQVTGQLDHPGIVPVHELGLDSEGQVYFTMKLVRGRDLKAIFDLVHEGKEGWTQTRALGVLLKMCEAMAYAHAKGVIHRDLKPSNVMVGRFGEVFVMDWGLARVIGKKDGRDVRIRPAVSATIEMRSPRHESAPDSPLVTMDGDVVGTPAYMSPEQALGRVDEIGPQSDAYSAGAMLYHLLVGHTPYVEPGMRLTNHGIWYQVQKGPPAPLSQRAPDTPAELIAICEKAMARDTAERYADMSELAEDLSAYLENRVVRAYETGAWAELRKWVGRNKMLAAAILGVIVLALGGLALANHTQKQRRLLAEQQEVAARERADALRMATVHDVVKEADSLWPPAPELVDVYDRWLVEARLAIEPMPELRERIADIESRSNIPPEELWASHPRFAELESARRKLDALRRAQAVRDGELDVQDVPLGGGLPSGSLALIELATPLVDPERVLYGDELRGLALARLALERVEDDEQNALAMETHAWALFANGLDEDAREEMEFAVSLAPEALRERLAGTRRSLTDYIDAIGNGNGRAAIADLEREVSSLETEISRSARQFQSVEDRRRYLQLTRVLDALEDLADPDRGIISGISPEHGWGIETRRSVAETIERRSISGDEARAAWKEAIESISDVDQCPMYGGLQIDPQLGLLPIARDPTSGLWEFAHLMSGEPASRSGRGGEIELKEESGIVLVLLPGGPFTMGAQSHDPAGPNYDPHARSFTQGAAKNEAPPHLVTLSPFFLSKYEMTQGQWLRLTGENPSYYGPAEDPTMTLLYPVETVGWEQCVIVCERVGLTLPSEAQWEYAARGGTTTPWWTGNEAQSLADRSAANLADQRAAEFQVRWPVVEEWLNDGFVVHAPVNWHAANPFGLHGVHGNVGEWCMDAYAERFYELGPTVDPVSRGPRNHVIRGGHFAGPAVDARVSARYDSGARGEFVGLRAARALAAD